MGDAVIQNDVFIWKCSHVDVYIKVMMSFVSFRFAANGNSNLVAFSDFICICRVTKLKSHRLKGSAYTQIANT